MDDADRALVHIENARSDGIAAARRANNLIPAGFCHWCAEPVGASMLFCDSECRDDYEHEKQMKTIAGRR